MADQPGSQPSDLEQLQKRVEELERRLILLEEHRAPAATGPRIITSRSAGPRDVAPAQQPSGENESIESRIGEYGMAWLGNIVLLFGIMYLTQLLHKGGHQVTSVIFGLASIAGVYAAGYYSRKSFPYMSRLFNYNGHILLFITAMRIHVLPGSRIIENHLVGEGVVLLVLIVLIYLAFRNKSQVHVVIVWIMAVITAIASNSTSLMLLPMVGVALTAIFFASRNNWWTGLIISIGLVYFTFLIWIAGDPIVTGTFKIISAHHYGHIYLFICALLYSSLALFPKSDGTRERFLNASIVLNGLGFSFILGLAVMAFFTHNYYIYFGLIAAFCMGYSIFLQWRGTWRSIASLYAIYSFVALSIAIAGIYKFPLAFFLLSVQSLLVVSMALWFRSRFIVIMNTILFVSLLIAYLVVGDSMASINFSFALVALITARIMNWKKKRLEIKTEWIRNIYLFIGSVMVLYSLQRAVPPHFVTLSWTLAALLFFVLSVLIHNIKYRWLAIMTMIATVLYLFIIDLKNISLGYRIVALMFIAVISLGISVFYTRRLKSKKEDHDST